MAEIVNDNRLELMLTQYGINRIAQAMDNPSLNLALTKIKIGNGDNNEYYVPTEDELGNPDFDLKGKLNYEFYVYDKQLLEDGLTVSFHTIIPEDVGGFDIREVGLYEVDDNGNDHLFAIAVQQPLVKPSPDYNYFINVNYYIFLKAQNFADLYDRIVLDVEHAQVSEADMEALMRNFLFAQENLMVQIGKNTELLGYNRPTQILDKVNENKTTFSYITLYKNFASVLDLVNSPSDIFSYWIFDYSRRENIGSSIIDLSDNRNYLATNTLTNYYPHLYNGFQSMFTFGPTDYYMLDGSIPIDLYDAEYNMDKPFTMAFVVAPTPEYFNQTRTLLAKSNRETGSVVFEVQELNDKSLQVRLYSDSDNYMTFKSNSGSIPQTPHVIVITYDPEHKQILAYINSKSQLLSKDEEGIYTHMNPSPAGTLYKYNTEDLSYTKYFGDVTLSQGTYVPEGTDLKGFCSTNGAPDYNDNGWSYSVEDNVTKVRFEGEEIPPSSDGSTSVTLYSYGYYINEGSIAGQTPNDIIYTKTQLNLIDGYYTFETGVPQELYNSNFELVENNEYGFHINSNRQLVYSDVTPEHVKGSEVQEANLAVLTKTITKYVWEGTESIYVAMNSFVSDSTKFPSVHTLYELVGEDAYIKYTGDNWKFVANEVEEEEPATYSLKYFKYGEEFSSQGVETAISLDVAPLASYVINESGQQIENVCSSIGLISIIEKQLSSTDARVLALNLCATLGRNPFLSGE